MAHCAQIVQTMWSMLDTCFPLVVWNFYTCWVEIVFINGLQQLQALSLFWVSLVDSISHVLSQSLMEELCTSMWLYWETTGKQLLEVCAWFSPDFILCASLPLPDHCSPFTVINLSHDHDYILSPPTASSNLRVVLNTSYKTIHHDPPKGLFQEYSGGVPWWYNG